VGRFLVKAMIPLLAAMMVVLPLRSAQAELVSTGSVLAGQSVSAGRGRLQALLARADVRKTLAAFGVDADQARAQVAALSDAEIAALDGHIDSLPAGSGVVTAIAVTFIVLIVLDVLGITDIFTFIHPIR